MIFQSASGKSAHSRLAVGDDRVADRVERLDVGVALEEALHRRHLPERRSERVDVDPAIDGLAVRLLRREVRDLPLHDAVDALREPDARPRKTEVDELHLAPVGEKDVRRVDVAVDDAEGHAGLVDELVCRVEPFGDAGADPGRDAEVESLVHLRRARPRRRRRSGR